MSGCDLENTKQKFQMFYICLVRIAVHIFTRDIIQIPPRTPIQMILIASPVLQWVEVNRA